MAGVALVPAPVEVLGHGPELDDQVARQVLRLDLAALLAPEAQQGGLVVAHDDPGVRAADEAAPVEELAIFEFDRAISCSFMGLGHGAGMWINKTMLIDERLRCVNKIVDS